MQHAEAQHWIRRHGPALRMYARSLLRSDADADDALQEGFIRFWRQAANAHDPLALLYTCIRSAALDALRARKSRERREAAASPPLLALPVDATAEAAERRAAIETALADLPADQREVIILKVWGELTFEQIAATLALPQGTITSRYRYALAKLSTILAKEVQP